LTQVAPERFREVLGHLPTGVTVVTGYCDGPAGMAANSVTSVSLTPPMVLVCPAKSSSTWPTLRTAGQFCVNVMAGHHGELCRRFALKDADRFADVSWHERVTGPGLDEAIAWIDCTVHAEHDAGDHTIVLADVVAVEAAADAVPLIFFRGGYGAFTADPAGGG
jgi:3-hydroxy-9,10-secoandrosta-1,3,5(10)-triene-9,17-dione monooxygenase reductase component